MIVTLAIQGHLPTKKNNLRRARNGRLFRAAQATAEMEPALLQIQSQWRRRPPVERARVHATFWLAPKRRSDGDGMMTTLLDLLTQAGVLADDNWRRVPSHSVCCEPAADDEHIDVTIEAI